MSVWSVCSPFYQELFIVFLAITLVCTGYIYIGRERNRKYVSAKGNIISAAKPGEIVCTNITSKESAYTSLKPSTNLDLPCKVRGTCDKIYLFILCPPYSGSTAIYSLLSTSVSAVTLLESKTWAGEGQWLYFQQDPGKKSVRWDDKDGFFNATLYSEAIRKEWNRWNPNATVFIEKSPPNIIRAHKLYNEFREFGRVRFILMLQSPCLSRFKGPQFAKYIEYAHIIISQFKEITYYMRYEELLLNLEEEVDRIKIAFPELSDIDPSKKPKGNFGKRSTPLSDYINSISTIQPKDVNQNSYLLPRQKSVEGYGMESYQVMRNLGLI